MDWALYEAVPDGVLVVDGAGLIVSANRRAACYVGYEPSELVGARLEVLLPPRHRARHATQMESFFARIDVRAMGTGALFPVLRKDGSEAELEISLHGLRSGDAEPRPYVVATLRTPTPRDGQRPLDVPSELAVELAQVGEQLQAILGNLPDIITVVDTDRVIRFVSRTAGGYQRDRLLHRPLAEFVPEGIRERLDEIASAALSSGVSGEYDHSRRVPDGSTMSFHSVVAPIRIRGRILGAMIVSRDVTEVRRTEAHLVASDRMAAVGTLAAGIAHEINNPLAAIIANLDLAHREVDALLPHVRASELAAELADARHAAERIRTVVSDLKLFSRSDGEQTTAVELGPVLASTIRMAWNEIRHRATFVHDVDGLPPVEANEGRLGQVLLNLLVNAAQAIPEGRRDANQISVKGRVHPPDLVVIEVSDTGVGIAPEVLRHLFQPFFTTKQPGQGTGLGLSICHRIVSSLGGKIEVQSELGRGSTFRVFLPRAHGPVEREARVPLVTPVANRRGKVLVIDDEALIGSAIRRILAGVHDVVATTRAQEALDRLAAGETFDVILCDVMMPEISGIDFYQELQRRRPELVLSVVFLTGNAFTERARAFLDEVRPPLLAKPFDRAQLQALVRSRIG